MWSVCRCGPLYATLEPIVERQTWHGFSPERREMETTLHVSLSALRLAGTSPSQARLSPGLPQNSRFIIQISSPQFVSGLGAYLVPPLLKAFGRTGLTYTGRSDADFAATVETGSDDISRINKIVVGKIFYRRNSDLYAVGICSYRIDKLLRIYNYLNDSVSMLYIQLDPIYRPKLTFREGKSEQFQE